MKVFFAGLLGCGGGLLILFGSHNIFLVLLGLTLLLLDGVVIRSTGNKQLIDEHERSWLSYDANHLTDEIRDLKKEIKNLKS